MAPLPPVRKRRDYADIGKDDLVSALFHDRLAGTPDAMQPSALARDAMAELAAADAAALKDAPRTPDAVKKAGHTGVMVALMLPEETAAAIAAINGVTEPADQLHMTLAYLGDSGEQALASNKGRIIAAMEQWATQSGKKLTGVINGVGRFATEERDGTNAVYLSPDMPELPALRQSLVEWIETSGFDYAQEHGFTPHITVAYVPKAEPTPTVRIDAIPLTFDAVTLAWGDEHYHFPMTRLAAKSFAVFKDAAGQWRWVARSTTAYRDRDQEIISLKALEEDAARMTASGQYGPLRWWHVGDPDPANEQAPWGDGYDLGTCDFSTVIGRCAIESGTFKSAEIAQWVAEHAGEFELSPGFFHAARDRDADGVFHRIHRFERSLVPVRFGRASNLFTGLIVQEAE